MTRRDPAHRISGAGRGEVGVYTARVLLKYNVKLNFRFIYLLGIYTNVVISHHVMVLQEEKLSPDKNVGRSVDVLR